MNLPLNREPAPVPTPFSLHIPEEDSVRTCASGLRARVSRTRRRRTRGPTGPTSVSCAGWSRTGGSASTGAPRRRGSTPLPQYRVPLHGIDLHFLHVQGKGRRTAGAAAAAAVPRLAGLGLRVPRHHPAADRPGRGSAATRPMRSRWSRRRCRATACRSRPGSRASRSSRSPTASPTLMTDVLGYRRFGAQGGDWGSFITLRLGYAYPDRLIGHPSQHDAAAPRPGDHRRPTRSKRRYRGELAHWLKEEAGYQCDPGHPAADTGLWPDRLTRRAGRLDRREVPDLVRLRRRRRDRVFSLDELLANISLYWFTGAIGSSFWPYYARMHGPGRSRPARR